MKDKQRPAIKALCRLIANHASDLSRVSTMFGGVAFDGARWVTIGTHEDEETGKKAGGRRVLINTANGRILKGGPKSWKGGKVDDPDTFDTPTENKTKTPTPPKETTQPTEQPPTEVQPTEPAEVTQPGEAIQEAENPESLNDIDELDEFVRNELGKKKQTEEPKQEQKKEKPKRVKKQATNLAESVVSRIVPTLDGALENFKSLNELGTFAARDTNDPKYSAQDALIRTILANRADDDPKGLRTLWPERSGFSGTDTPDIIRAEANLDRARESLACLTVGATRLGNIPEDKRNSKQSETLARVSAQVEKMRPVVYEETLKLQRERLKLIKNKPFKISEHYDDLGVDYSRRGARDFQKAYKTGDKRAVMIFNKLTDHIGKVNPESGRGAYDSASDTVHTKAMEDIKGDYYVRPFYALTHEAGHSFATKLGGIPSGMDISDLSGMTPAIDEDVTALVAIIPTNIKINKQAEDIEAEAQNISNQLLGYVSGSLVHSLTKTLKDPEASAQHLPENGGISDDVRRLAAFCKVVDTVNPKDSGIFSDVLSSYQNMFGPLFVNVKHWRSYSLAGGHGLDYFQDPESGCIPFGRRGHEFFANAFSMDLIGDPEARRIARETFPKTFAIYDHILDTVTGVKK